jgi:multidrug efflux pump subunit AcrA (membrane-fusion protein)
VRSGSFVSIHVVREVREGALLVPRAAVLRELQSSHVFVNDDGTAAKRTVEIGLEEAGRVEVLSGVEVGERVIVAGQGGLRDGAKVRVLGEDPESEAEAVEADATVTADAG